jgi:pyruvate dehydrogenase E2 component (dihydrolipoamide acetyltransferase)
MALDIQLPQLGLTMTEGLIMEWKKKKGETVKRGEILFNVENDKATIDVAAQADGILAEILVKEMITVPVGTVVGRIAQAGEPKDEEALPFDPHAPIEEEAPAPEAPIPPAPSHAMPDPAQAYSPPRQQDGFILASPLARRMAEAQGLELGKVRGTGPEGAVLARDLAASTESASSATSSKAPAQDSEILTLSRIQQIAAERMTESWTTIPQFTLFDEAEASGILALAESYKKAKEPVSLTVIAAKLLAVAAERHPRLNATWLGDGKARIYPKAQVNIAIDTADGLVVPVLRDCSSRGFKALGADLKALAEKAKAKDLGPTDYEGGTITLSNLGMFGISRFRAIVNPPQAAILAVGRISEKVLPGPNGFEVKKFIEYSITADHRVVDGAYAARFMVTLKSLIENPLGLLD